jgi:hypothetical protein
MQNINEDWCSFETQVDLGGLKYMTNKLKPGHLKQSMFINSSIRTNEDHVKASRLVVQSFPNRHFRRAAS